MGNATWVIDYEADVKKQIVAQMASGQMNTEDISVIRRWATEVEEQGLAATQANPTWRDHELFDEWKGHRAISFRIDGRLIYRIENGKLIVMVVRVTGSHDYKK